MPRRLPLLLLLCATPLAHAQTDTVTTVLDDFHAAASEADAQRYFAHFAEGAIFLGTDITERWTLEEFRAYAEGPFAEGRGWTYVPRQRHVYYSDDGAAAWFDEILANDNFGDTRGTGVLVRVDGAWKIAQYHLTLPVPNGLIYDLVRMIGEE